MSRIGAGEHVDVRDSALEVVKSEKLRSLTCGVLSP